MATVQRQPAVCQVRNSACFSDSNLQKLKLSMYSSKLDAGVNMFREGDPANSLYYVQSGKIKLTKLSEDGREYTISMFHTGDLFGQTDPFRDSRQSFSATTIEKCVIGTIQKSDLDILLWQHGDLAVEFMNWMGSMHRLTQTKFRDLVMFGKTGALCSTLIRLANTYGVAEEAGITISLKLTNAELADFIGCARESVNRMLGELKKAGAIAMDDGSITITNLRYLQNACRCELCPAELCRI